MKCLLLSIQSLQYTASHCKSRMWKNVKFHPSNRGFGSTVRIPDTFVNTIGDLKQKAGDAKILIKYLDLSRDPTIFVSETLNFSDARFVGLVMLDLSYCHIGEIFGLKSLIVLENLDLSFNGLSAADGLSHLHRLKTLNLRNNNLTGASLDLSGLYSLWNLIISNNPIGVLPAGLVSATKLTYLSMINCNLTDVSSMGEIKSLRVVNLKKNDLTALPSLRKLASLVRFTACDNLIERIDFGQTVFSMLQELVITNNKLTDLPRISAPNLVDVTLSNNNITTVNLLGPSRAKNAYNAGLGWPSLSFLDLSSNKLTSIRLVGTKQLARLVLNHNALTVFPIIEGTSRLSSLALKGNLIKHVPDLSSFGAIEYLTVSDNLVASVGNISRCSHLLELDITSNQIDYDGLVRLAYDLAETPINALHMATIEPGPVPAALGCIKTLTELNVTDNGNLPTTLGGLQSNTSKFASYMLMETQWLNTFFPRFYTPKSMEVIACFGKPCRQTIFMIILCLQRFYRLGTVPYMYPDLTGLIFSHWQAKDWALEI